MGRDAEQWIKAFTSSSLEFHGGPNKIFFGICY